MSVSAGTLTIPDAELWEPGLRDTKAIGDAGNWLSHLLEQEFPISGQELTGQVQPEAKEADRCGWGEGRTGVWGKEWW